MLQANNKQANKNTEIPILKAKALAIELDLKDFTSVPPLSMKDKAKPKAIKILTNKVIAMYFITK
jgi:hypothetical protein